MGLRPWDEDAVARFHRALVQIDAVFNEFRTGFLGKVSPVHLHAEFAYERGFRGCGLLNAAAEFPSGDAGRLAVRAHKEEVEQILVEHLSAFLPDDPTRGAMVARHLTYLLEGAMSRAGLEGESQRLIEARTIAQDILRGL